MTTATARGVRSPLSTQIAREVRAEMGRQGISSAAMARRLGVSEAWTSRRLSVNGDQTMDIEDLERIADVLGVPVLDLFPADMVRPNRRSAAVPVRTTPIRPRRDITRPKGRPAAESTRPQSAGRATSRRARVVGSPNRPIGRVARYS